MKFSDMPYERINMNEVTEQINAVIDAVKSASSAEAQAEAYKKADKIFNYCSTMAELAMIRHTINTKDEFYDAENDYMDEISPQITDLANKLNRTLLDSPYRSELENILGKLLFKNLEIAVRSFSPEITELMQEENRLCSEYNKLYASACVEWEGKTIPLPMLGEYKLSQNRETRRKAFVKDAEFFDSHREELDALFDKLVKVRNKQAVKLGYDNFIQLGYDRLGRNCYGPEDVKAFRAQIAEDLVPIVQKVKENQRRRIGVDRLCYYDNDFMFVDGNAVPQGSSEDILKAGYEMYCSMSEETKEFITFMFDNELFDVLSKEGKAPGGYCTEISDYKAPFIFSNFNGTSGDVDVLTHEAGHAFAGFRAMRKGYISDYVSPTIEACECHSMSMEFLTEPYHEKFFGTQTEKYAIAHCSDALNFIPYGCMVDEFQHIMYEKEDLTPEQRNEIWLKLEKKYRPYMDFDNLPFYARGGGWQRQLHIYLYPLYYIDYCMAQTVAFQFWIASRKNYKDAWARYLKFVDAGGTKTFEELVESAGLKLPYAKGCIKEIGNAISEMIMTE